MILVDTSGLLSAMFPDQRNHEECARVVREATELLISPFVVAELDYMISKYAGVDAELAFLEDVGSGAYQMAYFAPEDMRQTQKVIEKYRQLNIGLADASTFVIAENSGIRDVLTLDERHFRAMRLNGRKPFRILPADL